MIGARTVMTLNAKMPEKAFFRLVGSIFHRGWGPALPWAGFERRGAPFEASFSVTRGAAWCRPRAWPANIQRSPFIETNL